MLARTQLILVESLRDYGSLDDTQASELIESTGLSGAEVEKILVNNYQVEPYPLLMSKAKAYNLSPFNPANFNVTDQCFTFVDLDFCSQNNILPLGEVGSYFAIATADPLNPTLRAKIEGATKKPFYFLIALAEDIEAKFGQSNEPKMDAKVGFGDVVEALGMEFDIDREEIEESDLESEESAPVILLANRIVEDAYFSGGSDIHIEPFEKQTRVRVRIDGVCKERLTVPKTIAASLIARLKVMGNLDVAERRRSQDGRIVFKNFNRKGIDVDLRMSTSPMNYGEGCVMRLLDKQKSTLPLEDLGFSEHNLDIYRSIIQRPYGMILHCGPTGSGKSMTLYSALNEINHPGVCIRTAEDPIEYTLPGICQVQMNRRIGVTFATALRSFLRQDPDILLVGEIRDAETAQIAVEAALTGHLLFSTLHTNDAASAIARITEIGVEPFMISSSLLCVCAQRLLRRLCESCKQTYKVEGEEKDILERAIKWSGDVFQPKESGCPNCGGSGYRGRLGIHELMAANEELVRGINMGLESSQLKGIAIRNDMRTLHQDSMEKVKMGFTSIEECVATVPPDIEDIDLLLMQEEIQVKEA